MGLTEIEYGALASSEVMNNNFQYLDDRITTLNETVISNQATVNSNLTSTNTSISTLSNELSEDITELNASLNDTINQISSSGLFVTTYVNGASWYREYFSDAEKTTRVWLEQGGKCGSQSTVTYLKAFKNTNYTLCLGTHCTYYEGGGIQSKTASQFTHYNGKGWSYNVEWFASGK